MSKKSGPLNKAEKFYLDNNNDTSLEELAEDLNRSEKVINTYLLHFIKIIVTSDS